MPKSTGAGIGVAKPNVGVPKATQAFAVQNSLNHPSTMAPTLKPWRNPHLGERDGVIEDAADGWRVHDEAEPRRLTLNLVDVRAGFLVSEHRNNKVTVGGGGALGFVNYSVNSANKFFVSRPSQSQT